MTRNRFRVSPEAYLRIDEIAPAPGAQTQDGDVKITPEICLQLAV